MNENLKIQLDALLGYQKLTSKDIARIQSSIKKYFSKSSKTGLELISSVEKYTETALNERFSFDAKKVEGLRTGLDSFLKSFPDQLSLEMLGEKPKNRNFGETGKNRLRQEGSSSNRSIDIRGQDRLEFCKALMKLSQRSVESKFSKIRLFEKWRFERLRRINQGLRDQLESKFETPVRKVPSKGTENSFFGPNLFPFFPKKLINFTYLRCLLSDTFHKPAETA